MHSSSRHLLQRCIRRPSKPRIPPPHLLHPRPFTFLTRKGNQSAASSPPPPTEEKVPKHPLDEDSKYLRLTQDNLFHPLLYSPITSIRKKAMAIKSLALCPTSGLLEGNEFSCPNCGFPTHCSEEHYKMDRERHERESCDTLRIINEDLHDVQSGRQFPEFTLRQGMSTENQLNFTDWDHILFTRSMEMITSERSLRHLTNVLSYPYTIAGVLHEHSPYNLKNRLTIEGVTSMAALRTNALHPAPQGIDRLREAALNTPTVRIFVLGARGESGLPRYFWEQLCYCFWRVPIVLYMIGPEAVVLPTAFQARSDTEPPLYPETTPRRIVWRENPHRKLTIETYQEKFQVLHDEEIFQPFDPYTDVFFLFSPICHTEDLTHDWAPVIPQLLKTKCSIFVTDSQAELMEKTVDWVTERFGAEMDEVLEPGVNAFRSLKVEVDMFNLDSFHQKNMYIWGFRGKRYQVQDNWALL